MKQNRQRVRLAVDLANRGSLLDSISNDIVRLVRNTDIQFELGFFFNGTPLNIADWQTVSVVLLPSVGSLPLILQSFTGQSTQLPEGGAAWSSALTQEDWDAGVACHAVVVASQSQMAIAMKETPSTFQISITASSSLVPEYVASGAVYSGGAWSVVLPAGTYNWTPSTNDGSLTYGVTTLSSGGGSQNFTLASSTTVTLHSSSGHSSDAVTAQLINTSSYTPSQSVGSGTAIVTDLGFGKATPPASNAVIYLTEAIGDARYLLASTYASLDLSSAVSTVTALSAEVASLSSTISGIGSVYAPIASPTFTGTVILPTSTNTVAALRIPSGVVLTSPVSGSIEFNGTNLFYTTSTPTRMTVASTTYVASQLADYAALAGATFTGAVNISGTNIDLKLSWTTTLPVGSSNSTAITLGYANAQYLTKSGGTMTGAISLPAAQATGNITSVGVSPAASQYWVATQAQALVASDSTAQSAIAVNTIKALSAAINNSTTFYQTVLPLVGGTLTGDLKLGYTTTLIGGYSTASAVSVGYAAATYIPLAAVSAVAVSAPINFSAQVTFATAPTSSASYASPSSTWLATVGWATSSFAGLASPTFTGLVTLPTSTTTVAALKIPAGSLLTTPVAGVIEFNGTNLFYTTSTPTRMTVSTQTFLSGSSAATGGNSGDYYLQTTNGIISKNTSGTWAAVYTPVFVGLTPTSAATSTIATSGSTTITLADIGGGAISVSHLSLAVGGTVAFSGEAGDSGFMNAARPAWRIENAAANSEWWGCYVPATLSGRSLTFFQRSNSAFFQIAGRNENIREGSISFYGDILMDDGGWAIRAESGDLLIRSGSFTGTTRLTLGSTGNLTVHGSQINIGANKVIGAQATLSMSGGSTGATGWVDSTAQSDFNELVTQLRTHGLFA